MAGDTSRNPGTILAIPAVAGDRSRLSNERVVEILAANAMTSFAVRTPGGEKFRLLRATQYQAADLARQIAVERADSICPPGEILLYCSRGGAPFCASPTKEHDRC